MIICKYESMRIKLEFIYCEFVKVTILKVIKLIS